MLLSSCAGYHFPLLVLPKDHIGSQRISYIISNSPGDPDDCSIQAGHPPGTAPVCSHDELSGMTLTGTAQGFDIVPVPEGVSVRRAYYELKIAVS